MIDLGPNAIFIVSSYAGVFVVTSLLIIWVWASSKKQRARLDDLKRRGIYRRSENDNIDSMEQTS